MDPLLISMVGLSRWESVFVQTTVDLASGMEIAPWRFVDDPKGADVLLVDGDHRNPLSDRDGDDSQRPIVVSFTADSDTTLPVATRGLMRPVGYMDLIAVLKEIEQELHESAIRKSPQPAVVSMNVVPKPKVASVLESKVAPVQKPKVASVQKSKVTPVQKPNVVQVPKLRVTSVPIPKVVPATESRSSSADALLIKTGGLGETLLEKTRPARRFVEETRLLGLLNMVLRIGSSAAVTHPKFPTVLIIPKDNIFVSFGDPISIPRMFRDSATLFSVSALAADVEAKALASDRCRPLGQLLYCAALFGSEGRLLLKSEPSDTLRLVDWPDFGSLPHLPEHREIASFMTTNSTHLADIASSTGVSISVAIDFCNACEAVGLLQRISADSSENADEIDEPDVVQLIDRVRDLFKDI